MSAASKPANTVEREAKLDAGLHFSLPDLDGLRPGLSAVALPDSRLQAVYVDTDDLRLMRWGITLRHRHDAVGGAGAEDAWTVKLPGDADGVALVRRELTWPGRMGPVPAEVAGMVRAAARRAPLRPVARLNTQRRRVAIVDGAGQRLAEVDDDVVSVLDGRRLAARFREVEVELVPGAPPALLDLLVERIVGAGATPGDNRPKVVRAIGPRATQGPDVLAPALGATSTVGDVVRAAIAAGVTRMIRHDPGVRLGDDPEHVHQARVGTRRLRSDLRTFRPLLDGPWAEHIRSELGWVAAALGQVRDADVLTERLRAQVATLAAVDARPAAALLRRLALQREDARVRLFEVLDSDRYVGILEELSEAAGHPRLARPPRPVAATRPEPSKRDGATVLPPAPPSPPAAGSVTVEPAGVGLAAVGPAGVVASVASPRATNGLATNGWQPVGGATPVTVAWPAGSADEPGVATDRAGVEGAAPEGSDHGVLAAESSTPGAVPADGPVTDEPVGPPADGSAGAEPDAERDAEPDAEPAVGSQPAADVLPALVRRPWRHLRAAVDALGDDPADEQLHEIRIRAKRLRYAAEAVTPVVGRPARRMGAAAAGLQGVLGDFNDAVVAEAWLRAESTTAAQALVAGQLITLERQEQELGRQGWRRPWRRLADRGLRAWLRR